MGSREEKESGMQAPKRISKESFKLEMPDTTQVYHTEGKTSSSLELSTWSWTKDTAKHMWPPLVVAYLVPGTTQSFAVIDTAATHLDLDEVCSFSMQGASLSEGLHSPTWSWKGQNTMSTMAAACAKKNTSAGTRG
eukprot:1148786-Pelagomonas_calceolata.AAC.1